LKGFVAVTASKNSDLKAIENSQNILLVLDDNKPELQEIFETYTDTWERMVKVEILKQYTANGKTIFTMNPDFEDIGFIEPPTQEEAEDQEKYRASIWKT
jgi:hypothetical protein